MQVPSLCSHVSFSDSESLMVCEFHLNSLNPAQLLRLTGRLVLQNYSRRLPVGQA